MDVESTSPIPDEKPPPTDIEHFLPWACNQYQMDQDILIMRGQTSAYTRDIIGKKSKNTNKGKNSQRDEKPSPGKENGGGTINTGTTTTMVFDSENIAACVRILAFYDGASEDSNLVHLKFEKNKHLPRKLFKILALIIEFHQSLETLTINRSLDQYIVYEISKLLPISNITELCFDNCVVNEGNYYLLLGEHSKITNLSLCRCLINDDVLETIAENLIYPRAASKVLTVLNLSSNRITDNGVKFLAEALRTNCTLIYLNLSGNQITDAGASNILDQLVEFPITSSEMRESRTRLIHYHKQKSELTQRLLREHGDSSSHRDKKKAAKIRPPTVSKSKKAMEKVASVEVIDRPIIVDATTLEKATKRAENFLGKFSDPFCKENTVCQENWIYCKGNFTLAYLNLSYNDLSYASLRKCLKVFRYQRAHEKPGRGLVNVCLSGNNLPAQCQEFDALNEIIETGVEFLSKSTLAGKRKTTLVKKS